MNVNIDIILQFANLIKAAQEKRDENRRKFLENKLKDKLKKKTTQIQTEKQQEKQQQQDAQQAAQNSKKKKTKKDEEPSASKKKFESYLLSPLGPPIGSKTFLDLYTPEGLEQHKQNSDACRYIEKGVKWYLLGQSDIDSGVSIVDDIINDFPDGKKSIKRVAFSDGFLGDGSYYLDPKVKYKPNDGCTAEIWFFHPPTSELTPEPGRLYRHDIILYAYGYMPGNPRALQVLSADLEISYAYLYPDLSVFKRYNVSLSTPYPGDNGNLIFYTNIAANFEYEYILKAGWNHFAVQKSRSRVYTLFLNGIPLVSVDNNGNYYFDSANTWSGTTHTGTLDTSYTFTEVENIQFYASPVPLRRFTGGTVPYESISYHRGIRYTTKQIYSPDGFTPRQY